MNDWAVFFICGFIVGTVALSLLPQRWRDRLEARLFMGFLHLVAAELADAAPVAGTAPPAANLAPALPPPPGADRFALRVPLGHFVVVFQRELELPGELARLIQLDQALGQAGGWRTGGRN